MTDLQQALEEATDVAPAVRPAQSREFFCFRVGDFTPAVPSENVREVIRIGPLTPLPRAASYLLGVCGYRGEVFPVVDLLRFFGRGEAKVGPRTWLVVGVSGTLLAAVVADKVIGLRQIPDSEVLPTPLGGDLGAEHLAGVVRTKPEETLVLLNFSKLLESARPRTQQR